jgi:hypothetical protein
MQERLASLRRGDRQLERVVCADITDINGEVVVLAVPEEPHFDAVALAIVDLGEEALGLTGMGATADIDLSLSLSNDLATSVGAAVSEVVLADDACTVSVAT